MVWKVKIIHYEKKILPQYNSGKWSTEWLPKCESYPQRGKKLFKTPNQGKSCLCNSSNWLWQMSNFLAFSSDKASFGKKAGWNASYNRCDISVHWDHKRSSAKCKQNGSCSGNDNTDVLKWSCKIVSCESWFLKEWANTMPRRLEKQVVPIAINNEVHSVTEW